MAIMRLYNVMYYMRCWVHEFKNGGTRDILWKSDKRSPSSGSGDKNSTVYNTKCT